jgi:lipoprotein-anchoring transpeptidase ErfK/SrfK
MTSTAEKIQSSHRKFKLAKRWILVIIFLVLLPLTASQITSANRSHAPLLGNILVTPSLTSTAVVPATPDATLTATNGTTPTATQPAIATTASTSEPTATITPTPSSTPPTTIRASGYLVNLRTGPGTNFSAIQKLTYDEQLILLGRLSDNTWLYVKTLNGQEGWIKMSWVNLAGIELNFDDYPVKTPSPVPPTTIKVSGYLVNLRAGPDTKFSTIQKLTYGEQLMLLGRLKDNTWLYVKTSDGREGWIKTSSVDLSGINLNHDDYPFRESPPTETSTPVVLTGIEDHWIDIDLSEQMLRAYDGTDLVASFLVSTGLDSFPTETGQYHIYVKMLYSDMRDFDYYLPDVPYTMYYSGDFAIHGTYWHHSFGTPMSHGCVNMDTRDAEWLYNWSSIGTLVNIHR